MAVTVTSLTPATGPVTGGTKITVVGTSLDTVTAVIVGGSAEAVILSQAPTSLVFRTPPQPAGAGVKVAFYDGTALVQSTTTLTYTAVTTPEALVTTLAGKMRLDVSPDGGTTWIQVRGMTTLKPGVTPTSEDDSDMDSGAWGSTLITGFGWQMTFTVKRGRGVTTGTYDPGQELVRASEAKLGTASLLLARWYDRTATSVGDEAYTGTAQVEWAPQGGNRTGDKVDVTLNGQGPRVPISNPVIATPALAGSYLSS